MWAYDKKAQFHLPNSRPKGPISKGDLIESSPFEQWSLYLAVAKHDKARDVSLSNPLFRSPRCPFLPSKC
jgi:hypothetical protein